MESAEAERLERLFEKVASLPPAKRSEFLDEACADDPATRAELESLLVASEAADSFFDEFAVELLSRPPWVEDPRPDGREGPDPLIGQSVHQYEIEALLGQGGMGVVYRAHDTRLDRTVALKFLPPYLSADEEAKKRFLVEARAAAALDHPNVCTVYEVGEDDSGRLFIAMAFYEGETLKEKLARGALPIDAALDYARQIAAGLEAAHAHDIIHRDIKPGNVIVTSDGLAKVLDFGLAKLTDVTLTGSRATMGTVAYMSPEQARGATLDHRSDLWSLGVVLYEMLAGERPFEGDQTAVVIHAILNSEPKPLSLLRPDVPTEVEALAARLLAKEPGERYSGADAVVGTLVKPELVPGLRESPPTPLGWSRKKVAAVFGTALVLVVAAIATLATLLRPGGSDLQPGRVAVLPLINLSGKQEDAYFAMGLHSQLLTQLHKIGSFQVISSTSVREYRDSPKNLRTIGQELGARYIGEGDVWKAGNDIRIDFQLIDAETDSHIWSNTYDRQLGSPDDVLAVTAEIARSIAGTLHAVITPEQERELDQRLTDNPDAYDLFVRGVGRYEVAKSSPRSEKDTLFREAIRLFQQAVRLDPGLGAAYAQLVLAHLGMWWQGFDKTEARVQLASQALDNALRLAPDLGETHHSLGDYRYRVERDYEGALEAFEEALRHLPGDPILSRTIAAVMRRQGRFLDAVETYEELFLRDPRNAALTTELGLTYRALRRNEGAAEWAERGNHLHLDAGLPPGSVNLATNAYLKLGRLDRARQVLARIQDSTSTGAVLAGFRVEAYERDYDAAASWLDKVPGPTLAFQDGDLPVAVFRARLRQFAGRVEEAREEFGEAVTVLEALAQGPSFDRPLPELAVAYAGIGDREAAQAAIETVTRWRRERPDAFDRPIPFEEMAVARVLLGDYQEAVDVLEQLMEMEYNRALTVADLRLDPTWDPLRDHPRFQALIEKYDSDAQQGE